MKKNYILLSLAFIVLMCFGLNANAQVLTLGQGTFTGSNVVGPTHTIDSAGASARYAYIFPASTVSGLRHGDTIVSFSFLRNAGVALKGNANMVIYVRNSTSSNFGTGSINWKNRSLATGVKKVYDKNPAQEMGDKIGWIRFKFDTPYVVDTVLGKNLEVLIQYKQDSGQTAFTFWSFENSISVPGYGSNQTKFISKRSGPLPDTTNFSTELHPTIRIEFPRSNFDLSVSKLYSMGKLPVPQGNPDSLKAIVFNVGKKDSTYKVYIISKGANQLIDSANYFIKALEEKIITLPLLYPSNQGMDTLEVRSQADANNNNNSAINYRLATEFVYSYKDPTRPIAGGIGFNGSTGDFVAKFYSSSKKAINQVSVSFSGSNQRFKLGVWAADGTNGQPGTLIWSSDTLTPAPSFITPIDPPVEVNGNYYVGVRQIGTINVGFGYQSENPVRKGTFYYAAPLGDTNWVDFSPDAPFKFAIEPRLQAANDVAPFSFDYPRDTIWLVNSTTMAPKATFINYGTNDQSVPFNMSMRIQRFGSQALFSVRQDTLKSGEKKQITFDSAFYPISAGDYDVTIITALGNDQMKDNDTLKSKVVVAAFKDVGPGTIFDPSSGFDYEQFTDTVFPTVFVQNYGLDNQGPFDVKAEIFDSSGTLIYADTKSIVLSSLNSILVNFRSFPCDDKGKFLFRTYTDLKIDVDKSNDTVTRYFNVIRSNDVAITSVVYPENGKSYPPPVTARRPEAILENLGESNQANAFTNYCEIYYNGNLVYMDSVSRQSFRTIPETLLFKMFAPTVKGYYTMRVYSALPGDQFRGNDTFVSSFAVGVPDDVEVLSIVPDVNSQLELNKIYATKVTIRNNGYNAQNTAFPLVFRVNKGASLQYVKIVNVTIDSGETKVVSIDSTLKLSELTQYDVRVYSLLSNDFVRSNDTIKGKYFTVKTYDIGADKILYPTLNDTLLSNTQFVLPLVHVQNFGDSLFKSRFLAVLKVRNASSNALLYNKSIDTVFVDSGSLYLQFPGLSIGSPIDVKLEAYTVALEDQLASNDTVRGNSLFRIMIDPAAQAIVNPLNFAKLTEKTPQFLPKVSIKNNGLGIAPEFFGVAVISLLDTINNTQTEVYRDTMTVNSLGKLELKEIDLTKNFDPSVQTFGKYKCDYNLYSFTDQDFSNNTIGSLFYITEFVGINRITMIDFKVYPNPSIDNVHVVSSIMSDVQLEVYNANGQLIQTLTMQDGNAEFDVRHYAKGNYTIRSLYGEIKFVVQ